MDDELQNWKTDLNYKIAIKNGCNPVLKKSFCWCSLLDGVITKDAEFMMRGDGVYAMGCTVFTCEGLLKVQGSVTPSVLLQSDW